MDKSTKVEVLRWAAIIGIVGAFFSGLLTFFTFYLSASHTDPEFFSFLWLTLTSTFVAAFFSWIGANLLARPLTVAKGALTGVFISWITHPILGGLWGVFARMFPYDSYNFMPENWETILFKSLLYTAWIVTPFGGILGGIIAQFQLKSMQPEKPVLSEQEAA